MNKLQAATDTVRELAGIYLLLLVTAVLLFMAWAGVSRQPLLGGHDGDFDRLW